MKLLLVLGLCLAATFLHAETPVPVTPLSALQKEQQDRIKANVESIQKDLPTPIENSRMTWVSIAFEPPSIIRLIYVNSSSWKTTPLPKNLGAIRESVLKVLQDAISSEPLLEDSGMTFIYSYYNADLSPAFTFEFKPEDYDVRPAPEVE